MRFCGVLSLKEKFGDRSPVEDDDLNIFLLEYDVLCSFGLLLLVPAVSVFS